MEVYAKRHLQQTAASWILLGTKPAQERYTFALVAVILSERLVFVSTYDSFYLFTYSCVEHLMTLFWRTEG